MLGWAVVFAVLAILAGFLGFVSLAGAFGLEGALVSCLAELDGGLRRGLDAVESGRSFVLEVLTDRSLPSPPPPPPYMTLLGSQEDLSDSFDTSRSSYLGPA